MNRIITFVSLFLFAGAVIAFADVVPYTDPAGQGVQDFGGNLALTFSVNSPITVDALGVFNAMGSGAITGPIQVVIYDTDSNTEVTPVVTFSGDSYTLIGFDLFQPIIPIVLPVGNYEVDAVGFSSNDQNGNIYYGSTGPTLNNDNGAITFTGAAYDSSVTLDDPSGCTGCQTAPAQFSQFDAGTFSIESPLVSSPEPGFYQILTGLGVGLAAFVFGLRRKQMDV